MESNNNQFAFFLVSRPSPFPRSPLLYFLLFPQVFLLSLSPQSPEFLPSLTSCALLCCSFPFWRSCVTLRCHSFVALCKHSFDNMILWVHHMTSLFSEVVASGTIAALGVCTLVAHQRELSWVFLVIFVVAPLPPKKCILVHKNSLVSCQRCRHSVESRDLTCPFKQSNLSAWSLLNWHPTHTYLWGRLCFIQVDCSPLSRSRRVTQIMSIEVLLINAPVEWFSPPINW